LLFRPWKNFSVQKPTSLRDIQNWITLLLKEVEKEEKSSTKFNPFDFCSPASA
jgi:hypothetical protein